MDNLTLKLEGSTGELIIREGQAPPVILPKAIRYEGDIRSVSTFIKGRTELQNYQGIHKETTVITVDKDKNSIYLETNPNDEFSTTVKGILLISEELVAFCINGSKTFSQKELIKLLKFSRIHFSDPLEQQELLQQYMAFEFKTTSDGQAKGDDKGNKATSFNKTVTTNLKDRFTLKIPIYKGERSVVFGVDLCLDVTDAGARFWFESVELHELQQTEKEIIFKRELDAATDLVIIYK